VDPYNIILAAEIQFAKEVTLGVIYQQPPSAWHYLLPGMFIIDYLRRISAISRYTKHFMFPRKLALDAARSLLEGQEKSGIDARIESDIENWLNSLKLYSQELIQAQQRGIDLLIEHYHKLQDAEGNSLRELIENAYPSRQGYEAHVHELAVVEADIDRVIIKKMGHNEKLKEKLQLEARQVEIGRKKIMENIF
jgi:hypothetical protein